jgi:hypothetical protein
MGQLGPREDLARKYQNKADFYFVYTREAHPGKPFGSLAMSPNAPPAYDQTHNWKERAERAELFSKQKHVSRPILVDEDGGASVLGMYGDRDNELIVIDASGRIALKQEHADTNALDLFLADY